MILILLYLKRGETWVHIKSQKDITRFNETVTVQSDYSSMKSEFMKSEFLILILVYVFKER